MKSPKEQKNLELISFDHRENLTTGASHFLLLPIFNNRSTELYFVLLFSFILLCPCVQTDIAVHFVVYVQFLFTPILSFLFLAFPCQQNNISRKIFFFMSFCQLLFLLSTRSDNARIIFRSNHHPMACMLMTSQMMIYSLSSFHVTKLATVRFLISVVVVFLAFVFFIALLLLPSLSSVLSHIVFIVCYLFVVHLADIHFSLHRKINTAKRDHTHTFIL